MTKSLDTLTKLISDSFYKKIISYDGKTVRFKFHEEQRINLEDGLKEFGANYSFYPNGECELVLNARYKHDTVFFLNEKEFLNRMEEYLNDFNELNLVILQYEGQPLIKKSGEAFSENKSIFFNTVEYRMIIDFVTQSADFISFHDTNEHRILIISGDKGPFFIGYNRNEKRVKSLGDLQPHRLNLEIAFSKIDFIQFFKEAVIEGVHTAPEEGRFFEVVNSLQVLLDIATRDHTIYLRQFGFDKIKARFKEERVKYFESIERNIDSVSKQVTSFPLTFAASIFAGYQVKDKSFILFLILGAYALYSVIAWKILDVVAFNRRKIEEDVALEKANVHKSYQILYDDFKPDFEKIDDKVGRLKTLIILLRCVLIALFLGFAAFCIYQQWFVGAELKAPTEVKLVRQAVFFHH